MYQSAFTRLTADIHPRTNSFRPFLHKSHPKMIWLNPIWIKTYPIILYY